MQILTFDFRRISQNFAAFVKFPDFRKILLKFHQIICFFVNLLSELREMTDVPGSRRNIAGFMENFQETDISNFAKLLSKLAEKNQKMISDSSMSDKL